MMPRQDEESDHARYCARAQESRHHSTLSRRHARRKGLHYLQRMRRLALLVALSLPLALIQHAATAGWRPDRARAVEYLQGREGSISFAVIGPGGRIYGFRRNRIVPSASVVKVMLMATYLRHRDVRSRSLNSDDKNLLAPMIRRSDNDAATVIADYVGVRRINALAARRRYGAFSLDPAVGSDEHYGGRAGSIHVPARELHTGPPRTLRGGSY